MLPLISNSYAQLLIAVIAAAVTIRWGITGWHYWRELNAKQKNLVDKINAVLPQTQCGQCGYEGCLPYARAIANGTAINQCPPGGNETIVRLTQIVNEHPQALNPAHGTIEQAKVAVIREAECIGCMKCIKACPVDAILGGRKLMHTVITSECTGCDLCVAPCPVDCIDIVNKPVATNWLLKLPTELHTPFYPLDAQS